MLALFMIDNSNHILSNKDLCKILKLRWINLKIITPKKVDPPSKYNTVWFHFYKTLEECKPVSSDRK